MGGWGGGGGGGGGGIKLNKGTAVGICYFSKLPFFVLFTHFSSDVSPLSFIYLSFLSSPCTKITKP